jgi:hypothetical protein
MTRSTDFFVAGGMHSETVPTQPGGTVYRKSVEKIRRRLETR